MAAVRIGIDLAQKAEGGSVAEPPGDLSALILDYVPLVRAIARRIHGSLPPHSGVELNDLIQAGHVGLVDAGRSFRKESRVPFPAFARYRIRGEILDSLRKLDGASRGLRRWQKKLDACAAELSDTLQRQPTDEELSESLGVDLAELQTRKRELFSITSSCGSSEQETPEAQYRSPPESMPDAIRARDERRTFLHHAVETLHSRAREVILLYYDAEMTMKQIGEVMHVNESRVSQIHKAALASMANALRSSGVRSSSDLG